MRITTNKFLGMLPRYQPFVLPENNAQLSVDANLVSGGLEALRMDKAIKKLPKVYAGIALYRRGRRYNFPEDSLDKREQWLFFDRYIDLVPSPAMNDAGNMSFVSGLDEFRVFDSDTLDAAHSTIGPNNSYLVGIPAPVINPTITVVDGTDATQRTYTYAIAFARTWKSGKLDLGKISAPATHEQRTYVDLAPNKSAKITFSRPADYSERGITDVYIYRSAVTTTGVVTYRLVTYFPIIPNAPIPNDVTVSNGTFTFTDNVKALDLKDTAVNLNWDAPPDDLQGIITLRNGVLAGFKGKTVYISEPNMPHAWPIPYTLQTDYDIVGLGVFGNTLVVCTNGYTFMAVVSDPARVILTPIQEAAPCQSKRSIVNYDSGVLYASKNGIIYVTSNGARLVTKNIITEKEWGLYNPSTMRATKFQDRYVVFFDGDEYVLNGFIVDFEEEATGLQGLSTYIDTSWYDDVTDTVYVCYKHPTANVPYLMTFAEGNIDRRVITWTSKQHFSKQGLFSPAAAKINFYDDSEVYVKEVFNYIESSHAFNVPQVNIHSINGDANTNSRRVIDNIIRHVELRIYVQDRLRFRGQVYDNRVLRLPAGFRGDSCYFSVTSTLPIERVQIANSVAELT